MEFDNSGLKKRLIQSSFWMGEADESRLALLDDVNNRKVDKKPSKKMTCPADNRHRIKSKTLYPLRFGEDGFNCFSCKNKLGYQKIVALITCGHVLCKSCLDEFYAETSTCACGKKYLPGDVIQM